LPGEDGQAAPQDKTRLIPLVGKIAAGNPILAEQLVEEVLPLPESVVGKGELFMLQVKGDSMIDLAICDGDYVVIRSQKSAEKGEIVVKQLLKPGRKKMATSGYFQQMMISHQSQQMMHKFWAR
jgi:repressor LexA